MGKAWKRLKMIRMKMKAELEEMGTAAVMGMAAVMEPEPAAVMGAMPGRRHAGKGITTEAAMNRGRCN